MFNPQPKKRGGLKSNQGRDRGKEKDRRRNRKEQKSSDKFHLGTCYRVPALHKSLKGMKNRTRANVIGQRTLGDMASKYNIVVCTGPWSRKKILVGKL